MKGGWRIRDLLSLLFADADVKGWEQGMMRWRIKGYF
jgi:hypothetical protein